MNSTSQNSKKSRFSLRHLAVLALLTALCVVGRLSFTWIPNFKPVTAIVLLVCFYLGLTDALIVANLMILATSLYLGMGYWVIEQMLAYSLLVLLYFFLMKLKPLRYPLAQVIIAALLGMVYGFIISLFEVFLFRFSSFWAYYSAGIPFDLMSSFGNLVFMLLLIKPFIWFNQHYFDFSKKLTSK